MDLADPAGAEQCNFNHRRLRDRALSSIAELRLQRFSIHSCAGIVLEMPFALRACHHVEVVRLVAVRHDDRVIAARHHDDVVILDRERFVERAVVGVHALEREALRRVEPVIVGFLERAFERQVVGVVLVRRIARRMPARRAHLDDQQMRGRLGLRQDVADVARVRALRRARSASSCAGSISRAGRVPRAGRAGDADLGRGVRQRCVTPRRRGQIDRIRRRSANTLAAPPISRHVCALAAHGHRCRRRRRCTARCRASRDVDRFAGAQPIRGEADVLPAGRARRDLTISLPSRFRP